MTFKLAKGDSLSDIENEHHHAAVFARQITDAGTPRIVAGLPGGDPSIFRRLVHDLEAPIALLYILHTPRGEGEAGRYQSQPLPIEEIDDLLDHYGDFLRGDGRHHIWAYSPSLSGTVAWDNHNLLWLYGPLDRFEVTLRELGFYHGAAPSLNFGHIHHYRDEYDQQAAAFLGELDWRWSALKDQDTQP